MRNRQRFTKKMTKIVLLISFVFLLGRFIYSSIGAWHHHQDKKNQGQESSQPKEAVSPELKN